jgi:hypothetical protein
LFGWVYLFGLSPGAGESEGGVEEVGGFRGAMISLFFSFVKRTKTKIKAEDGYELGVMIYK